LRWSTAFTPAGAPLPGHFDLVQQGLGFGRPIPPARDEPLASLKINLANKILI
jgi:hypothetical protein